MSDRVRFRATALATLIAVLAVGACDSTSQSDERPASPSRPAPSTTASWPTSPGPTAAGSPEPRVRAYGPDYTPLPMGAALERIDGAFLASDRLSLTVGFTGGPPYEPSSWCSSRYWPSAAVRDDVLVVAIVADVPPERASPPPGGECITMGWGYLFTLALGRPFEGSRVRDLGSGELWIPPPDRLVELAGLPAGWALNGVRTGSPEELRVGALIRTYGPLQWDAADPDALLLLTQHFGGEPDDRGDAPVASAEVAGRPVTVRDAGGGGLRVTWEAEGDWLALTAYGAWVELEAFIALANSVIVPRS